MQLSDGLIAFVSRNTMRSARALNGGVVVGRPVLCSKNYLNSSKNLLALGAIGVRVEAAEHRSIV